MESLYITIDKHCASALLRLINALSMDAIRRIAKSDRDAFEMLRGLESVRDAIRASQLDDSTR